MKVAIVVPERKHLDPTLLSFLNYTQLSFDIVERGSSFSKEHSHILFYHVTPKVIPEKKVVWLTNTAQEEAPPGVTTLYTGLARKSQFCFIPWLPIVDKVIPSFDKFKTLAKTGSFVIVLKTWSHTASKWLQEHHHFHATHIFCRQKIKKEVKQRFNKVIWNAYDPPLLKKHVKEASLVFMDDFALHGFCPYEVSAMGAKILSESKSIFLPNVLSSLSKAPLQELKTPKKLRESYNAIISMSFLPRLGYCLLERHFHQEVQPCVVSICTFPKRKYLFLLSCTSLLREAEKIYVYLNDYKHLPPLLDRLNDTQILCIQTTTDERALSKLKFLRESDIDTFPYACTCDDDLCYDANYLSTYIRMYQEQSHLWDGSFIMTSVGRSFVNEKIVRYHAPTTIFRKTMESIMMDQEYQIHRPMKGPLWVDLCGTGASFYPLVKPRMKHFLNDVLSCKLPFRSYSLDDAMAVMAKQKEIPILYSPAFPSFSRILAQQESRRLYCHQDYSGLAEVKNKNRQLIDTIEESLRKEDFENRNYSCLNHVRIGYLCTSPKSYSCLEFCSQKWNMTPLDPHTFPSTPLSILLWWWSPEMAVLFSKWKPHAERHVVLGFALDQLPQEVEVIDLNPLMMSTTHVNYPIVVSPLKNQMTKNVTYLVLQTSGEDAISFTKGLLSCWKTKVLIFARDVCPFSDSGIPCIGNLDDIVEVQLEKHQRVIHYSGPADTWDDCKLQQIASIFRQNALLLHNYSKVPYYLLSPMTCLSYNNVKDLCHLDSNLDAKKKKDISNFGHHVGMSVFSKAHFLRHLALCLQFKKKK